MCHQSKFFIAMKSILRLGKEVGEGDFFHFFRFNGGGAMWGSYFLLAVVVGLVVVIWTT